MTDGLAVAGDSTDPVDAERVVAACLERFGRLDALVFSAGASAGGRVGERDTRALEPRDRDESDRGVRCLPGLAPGADDRPRRDCHGVVSGGSARWSGLGRLLRLQGRPDHAHADLGGRLRTARRPGQLRLPGVGAHGNGLTRRWMSWSAYTRPVGTTPTIWPRRRCRCAGPRCPTRWPRRSAGWSPRRPRTVNGAVLTVDGGAAVVDVGTLAFGAGASTRTNERRE